MGSEYTGVFIDGLQVGNAQNMQVDLGRFSTDGLDAVILYNAQKDGRLQSAKEYASGAAVHLVSAMPSFEVGKVRNMSARVRSGAFGTFEPTVEYERKLSDKNSLRLIGDYLYADGRYHFHKFGSTMVRQNTDLRSFRVEGSFYHRGSSYWNLRAWYYDSKRGLPGPVIRRLKVTTADRQMDKDAFLQGKWSKRYGDLGNWGSEGSAAGKYSFYYTRYRTDPFKDPGALPIDNTYRQHNAYGTYSHLFSNGKYSIGLAQDAEFSYLDANLRDFAWPKRLSTWDAVSSPLPTNASACHSICCTLLRQTGFPITKAVSRKTPKSAVSLPHHLHSDSRLMHIGHSQGSSRKHAGCLLSTTCIILWSGILLLSLRRHGNLT